MGGHGEDMFGGGTCTSVLVGIEGQWMAMGWGVFGRGWGEVEGQ